jgi:hypothetical protein
MAITKVTRDLLNTSIVDNGNATAITIDSSENVGIGTSSPIDKLHVAGNSSTRNTIVSNVTLDGGTAVANPYTDFGFGIDFIGLDYGDAVRNYAGIYTIMDSHTSSAGGGDAGFKAGLSFYTNGGGASDTDPTERLRILSGGGITFNGDTAAANALDDYEEGTWTPTLLTGTASFSGGTYTKVGRLVTANFVMSAPSDTTSTNTIKISLPFVAESGDRALGLSTLTQNISFTNITGGYSDSTSTFSIYGASASGYVFMKHSDLSGSSDMYVAITYMSA